MSQRVSKTSEAIKCQNLPFASALTIPNCQALLLSAALEDQHLLQQSQLQQLQQPQHQSLMEGSVSHDPLKPSTTAAASAVSQHTVLSEWIQQAQSIPGQPQALAQHMPPTSSASLYPPTATTSGRPSDFPFPQHAMGMPVNLDPADISLAQSTQLAHHAQHSPGNGGSAGCPEAGMMSSLISGPATEPPLPPSDSNLQSLARGTSGEFYHILHSLKRNSNSYL